MIVTASYVKENLTNLEIYVAMVNYNINNFNQRVKVNVKGLKATVDSTYYLMTNLFKAYHVASDTEFIRYTKTNKYLYGYG